MSMQEAIDSLDISELLHFTTNEGLVGMLASGGILSRAILPEEKYLEHVYKPNAEVRKDGDWLDYVNLSISRINTEFFGHSSRWHQDRDVWWCVVGLNPSLLCDPGVVFTTTNNIYTGVVRAGGEGGLRALFADRIARWGSNVIERPEGLPQNCPTCCQAEVLYPKMVPVSAFRAIYVATPEHADIAGSQIELLGRSSGVGLDPENIPIAVRPEIFE